jgi:hypothetical protein
VDNIKIMANISTKDKVNVNNNFSVPVDSKNEKVFYLNMFWIVPEIIIINWNN